MRFKRLFPALLALAIASLVAACDGNIATIAKMDPGGERANPQRLPIPCDFSDNACVCRNARFAFFTPDESKTIAAIIAKENHTAEPYLQKLDAIFYYGREDWVFWLAGSKWEPGSEKPKVHVVSVSSTEVRLQWRDDASGKICEVALKLHQALQTSTGTVLEP